MNLTVQAGYITPELQSAVQTLDPDQSVPVIITFADKVHLKSFVGRGKASKRAKIIKALEEKADISQRSLKAFLLGRGISRFTRLWIINGIAGTVPVKMIRAISHFAGVESVDLDYTVQAPEVTYSAAAPPEWNIAAIKATREMVIKALEIGR